MPKRTARDLSVGALATLALLVLAVTIMSVGGQSRLFSHKAAYRVVFPNTEGLRVGSPVKIAGVQVGTVTEIRLPTAPDAPGIEADLGVEVAYEGRVRRNSRVALARAVALAPRALLYDEPTTGLDPITANTINALIRSLQRRLGVTSIVVTHDIHSAFTVGDRIAFLHEGRILFHGTVAEARQGLEPLLRDFLQGGGYA